MSTTRKRRTGALGPTKSRTLKLKQFKLRGLRGAKPLRGAKAMRPGTGSKPLTGAKGL